MKNIFLKKNPILNLLLVVLVSAGIYGVLYSARFFGTQIAYRLPFRLPGAAACPSCNILIVNIDTLRPGDMPCYGYHLDTSSNLCRYADNNIRFTKFYAASSYTLDSHMSMFTGLYPTTHHVLDAFKDSLHPKIPTLMEILQKNGYRTVWAGLKDDVNLPLSRGFGRGISEVIPIDGLSPNWKEEYQKLLPLFLDSQPTFMFLHTYGVHDPYLPGNGPRKFMAQRYPDIPVTNVGFQAHSQAFYEFVLSEFRKRLAASATGESRYRNTTIVRDLEAAIRKGDLEAARSVTWTFPEYESFDLFAQWYYLHINKNDPAVVTYLKSLYDERIFQVDENLKPLLSFLERPDVKQKTIVIFLSDNGEEFMEHGNLGHAWNIYEEETHVPFIMSVPRVMQGVYTNLAETIDIMPTILELVGIPNSIPFEGKSLVPLLEGKGETHTGDRYLVSEHRGRDIISIRNSRWRMYKNNTSDKKYIELYDLLTDPTEQHNVLGKYIERARVLDSALTRILEGAPKYASVSGEFPGWIDQKKRENLIRNGYF